MHRRRFLRATALSAVGGLAGCTAQLGVDMPASMVVGGPDDLQSDLKAYVYAPNNGGEGSQFHFMPHVGYVEPGTTVEWVHAGNGDSLHSVTSMHPEQPEPALCPPDSKPFNSGPFGAKKDPYRHTFEEPGVYVYYCMPHKAFGMAAAMVVGHVNEGEPGWSPAMTNDLADLKYPIEPVMKDKIAELRHIIEEGGHHEGGHGSRDSSDRHGSRDAPRVDAPGVSE